MGVDAYITMVRIGDGLHRLDLGRDPVMKIEEPVAVIPFHGGSYGDATRSITVYEASGFTRDEEYVWRRGVAPVLRTSVGPVGFLPRRLIKDPQWARWAGYDGGPGGIPLPELEAAWSHLVPGYWAVTSYYATDCGPDFPSHYFRLPDGVQKTAEVKWRIWT